MHRKYTRTGLFADIGAAASYGDEYYFASDTGQYYYSDGVSWNITTFEDARSVYNHSAGIAQANVAQRVMPADASRRWLFLQNSSSSSMYVGIGYKPTTANGILLHKDGGLLSFETFVPTDAIYIICGSAGNGTTYVALEG
jgi:outer membrane protein W